MSQPRGYKIARDRIVKLSLSAAQAVVTATPSTIAFDAAVVDIDEYASYFDDAAPGIITIPPGAGGLYRIDGRAGYEPNATGIARTLRIIRNTTEVLAEANGFTHATNPGSIAVSESIALSDGDTILLQFEQDSGGDLDVTETGDNKVTSFTITRIAPDA